MNVIDEKLANKRGELHLIRLAYASLIERFNAVKNEPRSELKAKVLANISKETAELDGLFSSVNNEIKQLKEGLENAKN